MAFKVNGSGQAKVLFGENGLMSSRDRPLDAILFYGGCRVSEALALTTNVIFDGIGSIPSCPTSILAQDCVTKCASHNDMLALCLYQTMWEFQWLGQPRYLICYGRLVVKS